MEGKRGSATRGRHASRAGEVVDLAGIGCMAVLDPAAMAVCGREARNLIDIAVDGSASEVREAAAHCDVHFRFVTRQLDSIGMPYDVRVRDGVVVLGDEEVDR